MKIVPRMKIVKIQKMIKKYKITVIGLGYVGLPLALEFSKFFNSKDCKSIVVGFDIDSSRISELNAGFDKTNEVDYDGMGNYGRFPTKKN